MKPMRTFSPLSVSGQATTEDDETSDAIHPSIQPHYAAYKRQPLPALADNYLKAVKPIISSGISASGAADGPLMRSHAKKIVLDATNGYDESRGALKPYLMSHLQRLKRIGAQKRQILSVPERVAVEHSSLGEAENELSDRLGRPPSTSELADHTGISPKRIGYVRNYHAGLSEGQMTSRVGADGGEMSDGPAISGPDPTHARLLYLYDGLDPVDQGIVEHRYGLHGRKRLGVQEIADKFRLSPGAISQRAGRIAAKLDALDDSGVF